jgi:hypothetical protein
MLGVLASHSDYLTPLTYCPSQCFMRQHNRHFVYALLITERTATLYMFDRSGVCHSHPIDIHTRAAAFVRLLLGVWAPDDAAVGFDTSIAWAQDAHRGGGGAWRRHITTRDEFDLPQRYALRAPATPVHTRWFLEGRGTVCWAATDGDGERVLVKDLWREAGRTPEREFLKVAREMPGVGQAVGGEAGVWVSRLRGMAPRPGFVDRQFSRLVLKDYGACHIGRFVGHRDLLCGFRDAIAGGLALFSLSLWFRSLMFCEQVIKGCGMPGSSMAMSTWRISS